VQLNPNVNQSFVNVNLNPTVNNQSVVNVNMNPPVNQSLVNVNLNPNVNQSVVNANLNQPVNPVLSEKEPVVVKTSQVGGYGNNSGFSELVSN